MKLECVVDASVVVKLFIAEIHTPEAMALFDRLGASSTAVFYAPDLIYAEVIATLRKRALAEGYPNLRRDAARLYEIPFQVTPCRELMLEAVNISMSHGISSYDAMYVALSKQVSAPLITDDARLVRGLSGLPFDVRPLAEFNLPAE